MCGDQVHSQKSLVVLRIPIDCDETQHGGVLQKVLNYFWIQVAHKGRKKVKCNFVNVLKGLSHLTSSVR